MIALLRKCRWSLQKIRLRLAIRQADRIRLNLGAGGTRYPGWLRTEKFTLDITRAADWESLLGLRRADALLAEHVWEHLTEEQTALANRHCHVFLKPGGHLRLAVPDSLHPDPVYREHVRPGGVGSGAGDHKLLYDYRLLRSRLEATGFEVRLLEYWDESGQFHYMDWDSADGHISRSRRYDKRNRSASLAYTSLIVDAVKPG